MVVALLGDVVSLSRVFPLQVVDVEFVHFSIRDAISSDPANHVDRVVVDCRRMVRKGTRRKLHVKLSYFLPFWHVLGTLHKIKGEHPHRVKQAVVEVFPAVDVQRVVEYEGRVVRSAFWRTAFVPNFYPVFLMALNGLSNVRKSLVLSLLRFLNY